jgi:thioredoxin-like negative regulator of GroEL
MRVLAAVVLAAGVLLAALAPAPVAAAAARDDSPKWNYRDVMLLTDLNFTAIVEQVSLMLVEFYVPWCDECHETAEEINAAAAALKTSEQFIPIAVVDVTGEEGVQKTWVQQSSTTRREYSHRVALQV